MAVDFEEEARITETVTRTSDGRRGKLVPILLGTAALGIVAWSGYVSFLKPETEVSSAGQEEFRTASKSVHLDLNPETPPDPPDNRLVVTPPPPEPVVQKPPPVAPEPPKIDEEAAKRAAEDAERRRKQEELWLARLQSKMLVVNDGNSNLAAGSDGNAASSAIDLADDSDPNRKFVASVSAQGVDTIRATRNDRIDALIAQGTLIRGVLETAIQSDLPGMVRAVISGDVWSFDGRRILLPRGTMLVGEYRSSLARGQTRVLIVWTRALRADGTSIALGSYGTDDLGRSGVAGVVDKHYLERFGAASVLSIVGGISSFIAGLNSHGSSSTSSDAQSQAQQVISQTMSDMANTALKDSINISPTIHIDQGTEIMVFVRRDLDFSELYPDPVKEALRELRRSGQTR